MLLTMVLAAIQFHSVRMPAAEILVEAEAFDDYGGWVLDAQFLDQMGSPYLLAHGLGRPVRNATTTVQIPQTAQYNVWVRTKDWVPSHHPGRFEVVINSTRLDVMFGADGKDWHWQSGGKIRLMSPAATIQLHDLTGFDGRCDAIFLSTTDKPPPAASGVATRDWRRRLLGLAEQPMEAGDFDVVVVGGGVAGCAAALSAARLGCRVALIQNRPVLGGNASREIGIGPRGELGGPASLVAELTKRTANGDLTARRKLEAEKSVSLLLEHHAVGVVMDRDRIVAVDARHTRSGVERRFRAPTFIDCTGMAAVGILAGADTRFGREARAEFNERLAPQQPDQMHHGNTVMFRTRMMPQAVPFPEVPWAVAVAQDYADLGGQIERPGRENRPGPVGHEVASNALTHYWEYGQQLDPYAQAEEIRDHLFCAIYGTFANVKRMAPERYANLALDWVGHVPATGEFRRLVGDCILSEHDIVTARQFPDAVAVNHSPFCLHYPGHDKYDFRLRDWQWLKTPPYQVPFRCLYSRNIVNLMMAGKHISVTHIAGSSTKMMLNGGQHGVAVGSAAYLCKKHDTSPRGIYQHHLRELQDIVAQRGQ
jgi:glycine/D-amino acid oxidase-like deaminating enzyme